MTVKELKEKLEEFDDDLEVRYYDDESRSGNWSEEITVIEKNEKDQIILN